MPFNEAKLSVLLMKLFENYDRLAKQEMQPWLKS